MSESTASIHHEIRGLVTHHGPGVLTDPGEFRAAFEDVLGGVNLPSGTVNLLVDAVRHQVPGHIVRLIDTGADPAAALQAAGARFAAVRGGADAVQCDWASAVLGYATGRVPESLVRAFTPTERPSSDGAPPADPTRGAPLPRPPTPPPPPMPPSRRRSLRLMAVVVGAVVLLAGGAGVAWWVFDDGDGAQVRDQDGDAGGQSVRDAAAFNGTLIADPGAIRPFADPAAEIQNDRDLVDYLLPGLTGSGADCLEERIDSGEVLATDAADGAATVAPLVLACVAKDEIGKIFGMYAVGFEEGGSSRYASLATCVTDGFSDLDPAQVETSLVTVFAERLDLAGAPTSRLAAADQIAELTTCSTTASPEPTDTSQPSQNQRVVRWDLLRAGDCLIDLASNQITTVTVVDCETPHRLEVVGTTFSGGADDPGQQCANLYANYTGQQLAGSEHRLEHLQSAPGSISLRLVCLATNADRSQTTGSIR